MVPRPVAVPAVALHGDLRAGDQRTRSTPETQFFPRSTVAPRGRFARSAHIDSRDVRANRVGPVCASRSHFADRLRDARLVPRSEPFPALHTKHRSTVRSFPTHIERGVRRNLSTKPGRRSKRPLDWSERAFSQRAVRHLPCSSALTSSSVAWRIARSSTLPLSVESYPAVPPVPTTSRLLSAYSPAPETV